MHGPTNPKFETYKIKFSQHNSPWIIGRQYYIAANIKFLNKVFCFHKF